MTTAGLVLLGVGMLVGLVGVLLPILPGSLLIAVLTVVWLFGAGPGAGYWAGTILVLAILAVGTVAKYALPSRALRDAGAPLCTLALGVLGAIAGFVIIPVVGLPLGFVLGVYAGEYLRLRTYAGAWRSTRATLAGIGLGILIELLAATAAVGVWVGFAVALA